MTSAQIPWQKRVVEILVGETPQINCLISCSKKVLTSLISIRVLEANSSSNLVRIKDFDSGGANIDTMTAKKSTFRFWGRQYNERGYPSNARISCGPAHQKKL